MANGDSVECRGIVIHKLQRLRYLRTPYGPAVVNDMSKPRPGTPLAIQLDIGDFVEVEMKETEPYYHWRKDNPFRVLSFSKIEPPGGIERFGLGQDSSFICDVTYSKCIKEGDDYCNIYKAPFVDMIFDLEEKIKKPIEGAIYRVRLRIKMIRKKAGYDLTITQPLGIKYPEEEKHSYGESSSDFGRREYSSRTGDYERESSLYRSSTQTYHRPNYTEPLGYSKLDRPSINRQESQPSRQVPPIVIAEEPGPSRQIAEREERYKDFFFALWKHPEIHQSIVDRDGDLFDEIIYKLSDQYQYQS